LSKLKNNIILGNKIIKNELDKYSNTSLDISSWDMSNCENFKSFSMCSDLTLDISSWDISSWDMSNGYSFKDKLGKVIKSLKES